MEQLGLQNYFIRIGNSRLEEISYFEGPEDFDKNYPSTFAIEPGEHQVCAIHLDNQWVTVPTLPKADEMPITLKAVYQVTPTREATEHRVWTGRVESHSYNFTLRQ